MEGCIETGLTTDVQRTTEDIRVFQLSSWADAETGDQRGQIDCP